MSHDPMDNQDLADALAALRHAAENATAQPSELQTILDNIELHLDDLPILPELPPACADEDWDAPHPDDVPPDDSGGGDGGGETPGSGTPPGDVGTGASAVDGAGLTSLIGTPMTLGRALLTLALPAAVLGGLAGAGGSRLVAPAEASLDMSSPMVEALDVPQGEVLVPDAAVPSDQGAQTSDLQEAGADAHADGRAESQPRPSRIRDTLAQESRLIDGARTALSRGDVASCATFVAQHRRRFPEGALVEEREALDVRCRTVARDPSAAAAAGSFRDRFPSSPHLGSPE